MERSRTIVRKTRKKLLTKKQKSNNKKKYNVIIKIYTHTGNIRECIIRFPYKFDAVAASNVSDWRWFYLHVFIAAFFTVRNYVVTKMEFPPKMKDIQSAHQAKYLPYKNKVFLILVEANARNLFLNFRFGAFCTNTWYDEPKSFLSIDKESNNERFQVKNVFRSHQILCHSYSAQV